VLSLPATHLQTSLARPSAELLGFGCQASALAVVEAKPFVSELLPENPILLLEIVNEVALLLAQPARHRNHYQAKRIEGPAHLVRIAVGRRATDLAIAENPGDRILGPYAITNIG
jgi:hypothetical protein